MRIGLLLVPSIILLSATPEQAIAADYDVYTTGRSADAATRTHPGFLLMGGGKDVDEAFRWFLDGSGGGDVLVMRASGADGYNSYLYQLSRVNSVTTLVLRTREASFAPEVLDRIDHAEAIFLAGGDQWNYIRQWKGTPLQTALERAIRRGAMLGGTSAGLAVLGDAYFSAEHDTITSADALEDPFHERQTLGRNFLNIPGLSAAITDSHFSQRDRMGRLITWLARLRQDGDFASPRGIGIDERTAVLLQPNGTATVSGEGSAYFLISDHDPQCHPQQRLTLRDVSVYRIDSDGQFDLTSWTGRNGLTYRLSAESGTLISSQPSGRVY